MRKFWVIIGLMSAALAASFLVACGKSGSSGSGTVANPCPSGYCPNGYPGTGYYPNGAGSTIGFYSQSNNTSMMGQYSNNYNPSTLSPQAGFKNMLQEAMGVCDRNHSDGGTADCQAWMSGMQDIVFQQNGSTASQVTLTIRAYPFISNYYTYSYSLPSATDFFLGLVGFPVLSNPQGWFNPMRLTGTIWPIGNNQGFEIRANGPQMSQAYNKLIQIQVASGKVEDQQLNYVMYYNGAAAASGRMIRCQTQNCGLPY